MAARSFMLKLRFILPLAICLAGVLTFLALKTASGTDRSSYTSAVSGQPDAWPTPVTFYSKGKFTAPEPLKDERTSGPYIVRLYHDPASNQDYEGMVIIARVGEPYLRIDTAVGIDTLTGQDITGDHKPEIVILLHPGGSDCCYRTIVYETWSGLKKIMDVPNQKQPGKFEDTAQAGVKKFVTCGDRFSKRPCDSNKPDSMNTVYKFLPGVGYQIGENNLP